MSMSMDECRLGECPRCGENMLDPFSGVCYECGYDENNPEEDTDE